MKSLDEEPAAMTGALLISHVVERHFGGQLDQTAPGTPRVVFSPDGQPRSLEDVTVAYFSGDVFPEKASRRSEEVITHHRTCMACPTGHGVA